MACPIPHRAAIKTKGRTGCFVQCLLWKWIGPILTTPWPVWRHGDKKCRTCYYADSWRSPSSCPSAVWFGRDDAADSPKPGGSTRADIICDGVHDDPSCNGLLSPNVLPPPPPLVPLSSVKWCNDAIQWGVSSFKPFTSSSSENLCCTYYKNKHRSIKTFL